MSLAFTKKKIRFLSSLSITGTLVMAVTGACSVVDKSGYVFDDAKFNGNVGGDGAGGSDGGTGCGEGEFSCTEDGHLLSCGADGVFEMGGKDCKEAALCDADMGRCRECAPGAFRCSSAKLEQCNMEGTEYDLVRTCADAASCDAKNRGCKVCDPEAALCDELIVTSLGQDGLLGAQPGTELRTCNESGTATDLTSSCGTTAPRCDPAAGECVLCKPDEKFCANGHLLTCKGDGSGIAEDEDCGSEALCNPTKAHCLTGECEVNDSQCDSSGLLQVCNLDHVWETLQDCSDPLFCTTKTRQCYDCDPGGTDDKGTRWCTSKNKVVTQCIGDFEIANGAKRAKGTSMETEHCYVDSFSGTGMCVEDGSSAYCGAYNYYGYNYYCAYSSYTVDPEWYPQPGSQSYYQCIDNGSYVDYGNQVDCGSGKIAIPGDPPECHTCVPNTKRCDGNTLVTCDDTGDSETQKNCGDNICHEGTGKCLPKLPGDYFCTDAGVFSRVLADGTVNEIADCGEKALCKPDRGCTVTRCTAGTLVCDGASVLNCTDGVKTDPTGTDCDSEARCSPGIGCNQAIAIAAGDAHTCVIVASNKAKDGDEGFVMCWGANESGQLGNGSALLADATEPRYLGYYPDGDTTAPLRAPSEATAICAGKAFSCASVKTPDGPRVLCWGSNVSGQLGFESEETTLNYAGKFVSDGTNPIAGASVTCGEDFACALAADGKTWCWGANDSGQLGNNTTSKAEPKAQLLSKQSFTNIAAGAGHVCGVKADGTVSCWGEAMDGQIGSGKATDLKVATAIKDLIARKKASPALGRDFSIVLAGAEDNPFAFGANLYGQLGTGNATASLKPVAAKELVNDDISTLYAGATSAHACAAVSGALLCWGANVFGQLGDNTTVSASTPVTVLDGAESASRLRAGTHSVGVGGGHTCAITGSGDVLCWGANYRGQLASVSPKPVLKPARAF